MSEDINLRILEVAEEVIVEMKRKLKEAKDLEEGSLYRCSCCNEIKKTKNQAWRKFDRSSEVAICSGCDFDIEFSKWKTVEGYLRNN